MSAETPIALLFVVCLALFCAFVVRLIRYILRGK